MRIRFARRAAADLTEAWHYIAADSPRAATGFLAQVAEILGLLAEGRLHGRLLTLRDGRRVRTWPMPPYRVYYRLTASELHVVRLYHQARRPIERRHRPR